MTNDTLKIQPKIIKALYVIAIVFLVITAYMIYSSITYISSYFASYGMSITDGLGEAIQYIITSAVPYFVYAMIAFLFAKVLKKLEVLAPTEYSPEKLELMKAKQEAKAEAQDASAAADAEAEAQAAPAEDEAEEASAEKAKDEAATTEVEAALAEDEAAKE